MFLHAHAVNLSFFRIKANDKYNGIKESLTHVHPLTFGNLLVKDAFYYLIPDEFW